MDALTKMAAMMLCNLIVCFESQKISLVHPRIIKIHCNNNLQFSKELS